LAKVVGHEAGENIQTASSCSREGRSGDGRRIRFSADEGLGLRIQSAGQSSEGEKEEGQKEEGL
jgi:hypothetical protein